jgi:two-component system sensor histidine kinase KdpD
MPIRSSRRTAAGAALAVIGLYALTAGLVTARSDITLTSVALLYLVPVVIVAGVGGVRLGLAAAIASDLLLNWFFVPPYHTLAVDRRDNLIALLVYVLVAVTVAVAVDLAARERASAARSGVEAQLLARIASAAATDQSLEHLLDSVATTFGMTSVALMDGAATVALVGPPIGTGTEPPAGTSRLVATGTDTIRLVAEGPELFAEDRRLLGRLAVAAARTLETTRHAEQAAQLAEVDRVRTAILASVGHDLRTPLASIKAAASSLRDAEVAFTPEDRDELLATVEESTDRMNDLVENLLAMSRLQAGVLSMQVRPVGLDEVVARALLHVAHPGVAVSVGDRLPLVAADPGLLERVVANLVANAVTAAAGGPIEVRGARDGDSVALSIVDHGAGIPEADRERVFAPFRRLDDKHADGGLGLGLAIARGFTSAMSGTLTLAETDGDGLTATVRLPIASGHP